MVDSFEKSLHHVNCAWRLYAAGGYALAGVLQAVGASGAIFGMVGAWGAFCIMNQSAMGAENAQRSLAAVGQTLAFNLFLGMSSSQIDNMGHLGVSRGWW